MTVQTSKNPQVDIAEDNAFFPSEYSLSQYTSPVSDLDGVDYPKPYRGKHKILKGRTHYLQQYRPAGFYLFEQS